MNSSEKLNIDYQFSLYMKSNGLVQSELPPRLFREIKRAFFNGAGQLLNLMKNDLPEIPIEQASVKLHFMEYQIENYNDQEKIRDKMFELMLKRRDNLN